MTPDPATLEPWAPDVALAPPPDQDLAPEGFVVTADDGTRIHFLDWGGPARPDAGGRAIGGHAIAPGVLLLPGLVQPAWTWAPVTRRLSSLRRVVVADLRGQGLSDSPMTGYDLATLAGDAIAVAEGSGLLGPGIDGPGPVGSGSGGAGGSGGGIAGGGGSGGGAGRSGDAGRGRDRIVVAGLGFGAIVATAAAQALGDRCAGLVLVDGGWERLEPVTDLDVDEFLRGLDEPPEVLRTMDAFLADRRGFDPGTWDADQERAARDAVVETAAGHVVRAVRPHVVTALARTMFAWDPAARDALPGVTAPVSVLVALGAGQPDVRLAELRRTAEARAATGHDAIRVTGFPGLGHNLPRYRPADVTAAILEAG